MSEAMARKSFTGLLGRSALARRIGLSATSLSLEGREGSETAGQDGQNGQERTAGRGRKRMASPARPADRGRVHEAVLHVTRREPGWP
jgi:hypothetical protein